MSQHGINRLVWFETHTEIREAIQREKQLKNWKRSWKLQLIEEKNPDWKDLYQELI